jgi:hypothetical protein
MIIHRKTNWYNNSHRSNNSKYKSNNIMNRFRCNMNKLIFNRKNTNCNRMKYINLSNNSRRINMITNNIKIFRNSMIVIWVSRGIRQSVYRTMLINWNSRLIAFRNKYWIQKLIRNKINRYKYIMIKSKRNKLKSNNSKSHCRNSNIKINSNKIQFNN